MPYFSSDIHYLFEVETQLRLYFTGDVDISLEISTDPSTCDKQLVMRVHQPAGMGFSEFRKVFEKFVEEYWLRNQNRLPDVVVTMAFV